MENPPAPTLVSCQALEQFLLLAKSAKGSAVAELIKHATEASGVYVFSELLECKCVEDIRNGPHASSVKLLEIFAYSTYEDYKRDAACLPPLSPAQLTKLKHLTIVSLASQCRTIPYSTLLVKLDITNLRELEVAIYSGKILNLRDGHLTYVVDFSKNDLIIDTIYAGVIQAKLDQKNERLEVESFIGRDIKMEELSNMVEKLDNWCSNCMQVLQAVEGEMTRANLVKMEHSRSRDKREVELKQLKETLKVASTLEGEVRQSTSQPPREPANTTAKKGLRGSAAEETQSIRKVIHFAGN